jgi:hypothetical protein
MKMKQLCQKKLWICLLITCAVSLTSFSQSVTGIWRGYFISSLGENYKLEFQVKQNPGFAVSGVSYSYLDVRFYGKATMTGSFMKSNQNFRIREIRTVEVKQEGFGAVCIMNYDLHYSRSGKEEFLEGTYLGKYEVKEGDDPSAWGDCGSGKVFLRKVVTSDFYVEPFLRKTLPANPPVNSAPIRNSPEKPVTPPPVVKKTMPPVKAPVTKPPVAKPKLPVTTPPVVKKTTPPTNPPVINKNTPRVVDSAIAKAPEVKKQVPASLPVITPSVLKNRQNELMKSLIVNDEDVIVKLYDNGEIDGDSISVFLDKKLVLSNKGLSASPLTIKLKMNEENPEHELVMVAENLGRIPPNTSLMIVEAGDQRFDVRITSTEQKNAVVRFKYVKPTNAN